MKKDTDPRPNICLVTNELYPLSAGGIGRLMYNFACHNRDLGSPARLHYLIPRELAERPDVAEVLEATYEHMATLHVCPSLAEQPHVLCHLLEESSKLKWTLDKSYADAFAYYRGLLAAEAAIGRPFDIIEFPDFGGWALATVEAKRAGLHFRKTLIAARLHSTQGVIYRSERFAHHPSYWLGILFDAERHLLAHADIVVGHNRAVIDFNAEHYHLAKRWKGRTRFEFPPILLTEMTSSAEARQQVADERAARREAFTDGLLAPDFVFSSRLQQFKRPDLFIRAAVIFLQHRPDYRGLFRLVSYGWDEAYIDGLRTLVPVHLSDKIIFQFDTPPAVRVEYIRASIVVVPSDYESLCLFAFEAAQMGCKVILNRNCLAFSHSEKWQEDKNCLMFDGEANDLAAKMAEALEWTPEHGVSVEANAPYWLQRKKKRSARKANRRPTMTLVVFGAEDMGVLREQCAALSLLDTSDYDVLCLLPHARFGDDLKQCRFIEGRGWSLVGVPGLGEDAASFAKRLCNLETDLLALLPAGYELHPDFLSRAVDCLAADGGVDVVSGLLRIVDNVSGRGEAVRAYGGAMPSLALLSSRVVPRAAVFRRRLLDAVPFDSRAGSLWFEAWVRDVVLAGSDILIMPMIAADLLSSHEQRENSKHLTGGILDKVGLARGLDARLLAIDPLEHPGESDDKPVKRHNDALFDAHRFMPDHEIRPYPLVAARPYLKGLLVHPTQEGATIAELPGHHRRLKRIEVEACNASNDNTGIEIAVAVAPHGTADDIVRRAVNGETDARQIAMSAWRYVAPGGEERIALSVHHASIGNDRIFLMSRLPQNGDEMNCHLIFRSLDEFLNTDFL